MAQRNTYGDEEIFGANGFAVGAGLVPVGDGVGRSGQFVRLAVREGALFVTPSDFDLAFGVDTIDALVVQHTAVVLEEGAVASRDVAQHGREAVVARAVCAVFALGPDGGHSATGVAVATAAGITGINRAESVGRRARVIIKSVAFLETASQLPRYPRRTLVVGQRRTHIDRRNAGRRGISGGNVGFGDLQIVVLAAEQGHGAEKKNGGSKNFVHNSSSVQWVGPCACAQLPRDASRFRTPARRLCGDRLEMQKGGRNPCGCTLRRWRSLKHNVSRVFPHEKEERTIWFKKRDSE